MYRHHLRCRACNWGPPDLPDYIKSSSCADRLEPVFDLGLQPLANSFTKAVEDQPGFAPLKVMLCPRCNLAQLSVVVDPLVLYRNYLYRTSPSAMMSAHFDKLAALFTEKGPFKNVLEIGSNDGRLLHHLNQRGYEVCGIDPAENLQSAAGVNGVVSIVGLFNGETAERYRELFPTGADLVIARHVFCHVDDWRTFIKNLAAVTHPESMVAIEVPWVQNLLKRVEWDTIYHEHTSYFSLGALETLVESTPFRLHDVRDFEIHGGALLVLLTRREGKRAPVFGTLAKYEAEEQCSFADWDAFSERAKANMAELKRLVRDLRSQGKRVAALGASAKSTVIISACGFTVQDIAYIMDSTMEKLYRYSPGTEIPILPEGTHVTDMPDYLVCFCWNFLPECLNKYKSYLAEGGRFIVPVPKVEIVP